MNRSATGDRQEVNDPAEPNIIYFLAGSRSRTAAHIAVTPVEIDDSGAGKYSGECSEGSCFFACANSSILWGDTEPRRNMKMGTPARPYWLKSSPPIDCATGPTLWGPRARLKTGTSRSTSRSSLRVAGVESENSIKGSGAPAPAATASALRLMASSRALRVLS